MSQIFKRSYNIQLGDCQVEHIITALSQCKSQGYFGADAEGREEIDMLYSMFNDLATLSDDETGHNMTHGFCL